MTKVVTIAALALFTAAQFSCSSNETKPPMKTFKEKYSYMMGLDIGNEFKRMNTEVDYDAFIYAIKDITKNRPQLLTPKEVDSLKMAFSTMMQQSPEGKAVAEQMKALSDKNLKEGDTFLAENGKKTGVITTASGLQYMVIKKGNGPKPKMTDRVKVNYSGTLLDGREFDNSFKHNQGKPIVFPLVNIVPAWIEALQLMNVGSKYKLFVPSKLGYGERNDGPGGPNSTLIFEVELVGIEK